MLVQKLRVNDLQSEKGNFDGVMVYAQNKVGEDDGNQIRRLIVLFFFYLFPDFRSSINICNNFSAMKYTNKAFRPGRQR